MGRTGGTNNPTMTFSFVESTSLAQMFATAGITIACAAGGRAAQFTDSQTNYILNVKQGTGNQAYLQTSSGVGLSLGVNGSSTPTITIGGSSGSGALGFYGSGGTGKQTISGSKSANAALTSLLTALATLGLLTDSTT